MNKDTGVYAIISPSGKQYIGSAISIKRRWNNHKTNLRRGVHHNIKLQNAWNKYGESNMMFEVIARCPATDLLAVEQARIDSLRPYYNIALFAGSPTLGMKQSPEVIAKRSAAMMGRIVSEETRRRISEAQKGRKLTPEHVAKISGLPVSAETRAKQSAKKKGKPPHNKGKPLSKERAHQLWLSRIGKCVGADNHKARPVICVETGTEFLAAQDAVRWIRLNGYPKADQGNVSNCCAGRRKNAYGYHWRYAD